MNKELKKELEDYAFELTDAEKQLLELDDAEIMLRIASYNLGKVYDCAKKALKLIDKHKLKPFSDHLYKEIYDLYYKMSMRLLHATSKSEELQMNLEKLIEEGGMR